MWSVLSFLVLQEHDIRWGFIVLSSKFYVSMFNIFFATLGKILKNSDMKKIREHVGMSCVAIIIIMIIVIP